MNYKCYNGYNHYNNYNIMLPVNMEGRRLAFLLAAVFISGLLLAKSFPFLNRLFRTKGSVGTKETALAVGGKYKNYPVPAPLPSGKQTYFVSMGQGSKGPSIAQVVFDPIDPKKGETQRLEALVGGKKKVERVSFFLMTDYATKIYPAGPKEGTQSAGWWGAEVAANDSYDYVYRVRVEAVDKEDVSGVTVSIR